MLSIGDGSGLVYVEPADISLKVRLGCESSARCLFVVFSAGQNPELVSWDLSTDRLLQSCAFFRSRGVGGERHGETRAQQSFGRSVGAREGQEVVAQRRMWNTGASKTVSVSLFA